MKNKRVLWVTRTALFTAVLVVIQAITAQLGITLITGSFVNLVLIASVMTCSWWSGLTVALISPVFASLMGISPNWLLTPFIMAGNTALVAVWHLVGNRSIGNSRHVTHIAAAASAAVAKFIVLYIGVVRIAVPFILQLPEKQAAVVSMTFSFPQLFTALIGGAVAVLILPVLKKAIKTAQ